MQNLSLERMMRKPGSEGVRNAKSSVDGRNSEKEASGSITIRSFAWVGNLCEGKAYTLDIMICGPK